MATPDLNKLRKLSLVLALLIVTLVFAGVKLDVPAHVSPLGIPLTIQRPDLLTIGLVIASFYTAIRYIYFGMLVSVSPMRTRRELATKSSHSLTGGLETFEAFGRGVQEKVDRYFPRVGSAKVTFDTTFDSTGSKVTNFTVPTIIRLACVFEDFDFFLPVLASFTAICIWVVAYVCS